MSAIYTELSVDASSGLLRAEAALDRLVVASAAVNETVFPLIVADFHRMERRRWEAQGPGWEPLSPATLAIRRKRGITHDRILEQSGRLRAAATGESDEMRVEYRADELLIQLPFYAEFHQIGPRHIQVFGRGSALLPQRKVFEVRDVDALRWSRIVKRGLMAAEITDIVDLDDL